MAGSVLDTNVVIKYVRGDADAKAMMDALEKPRYLPVTAIGELFFGAHKSNRRDENIAIFNTFIAQCTVMPVSQAIAETYGQIKATLSGRGVNIPENDLWIAAAAVANGLPLATFDKHFAGIDDLHLITI